MRDFRSTTMTAGFVNATGFLGFSALTTNVTRYAALFAEGIARQDWSKAKLVATCMVLFLARAFTSSLIVIKIGHNARFSFAVSIVLETMVLVSVISGSVVLTTHLTGTLTDLGIELVQLRTDNYAVQGELLSRIKLRVSIILFFMLGELSGAYLFTYIIFRAFLIPV